jgi:tetratricopeptide (TPR) repeat protein
MSDDFDFSAAYDEAGDDLEQSGTALREQYPVNQLDFDILFYDAILDRSPNYLDVLRCQGGLLARKGLNERSLELDRRLVSLVPDDEVAHYNLACNLALAGRPAESLEQLRAALCLGYKDFRYLTMDGDLDAVRDTDEYRSLGREFGFEAE